MQATCMDVCVYGCMCVCMFAVGHVADSFQSKTNWPNLIASLCTKSTNYISFQHWQLQFFTVAYLAKKSCNFKVQTHVWKSTNPKRKHYRLRSH